MCGICGVLPADPSRPVSEARVRALTTALAHRGPDDEGVHLEPGVGLGHRRLAIVDRSPRGHQPMANDDGSVVLVFNGEIYNHAEQREQLEARGFRFRSRTDTEVLLRLYEADGEDCLAALRGMFAFAIWDARERKLFAARDRFGQKPFYYCSRPDEFVFASELRALAQDPELPCSVDLEAMHHFLSFDYVPGVATGFSGIHELLPGHCLVARAGRVQVRRYWRLPHPPAAAAKRPRLAELEAELVDRLAESVELRLMGEVPLGVFLSGGMDSTILVALLRRVLKRETKTFSISFQEEDFDEGPVAQRSAAFFGTEHRDYPIRPDVVAMLPRLVEQFGGPFGDPSAIPTYYLARHAREHVTVALGGDGGDECFAGYDRYVKNALAQRVLAWPRLPRRALAALLRRLGSAGFPRDHLVRRLDRFFQLGDVPLDELYGQWLLHFDHQQKRELYSEDLWRQFEGSDSTGLLAGELRKSPAPDLLARSLDVDAHTYLAHDILPKVDVATMAHSLEARSPFLDHEFAGFAAGIPSSLKLRGLTTKWILRRAFRRLLPREILRRPKRGFGLPIDRWLRHDLREMLHDQLLSRGALERGYFRPEALRRMVDEHASGERDWQYQLWNLLVLELWHQRFIDAGGAP